ncbi:MAG: thiamine pyrophosphate-binding protein [Bacteroidota bacterium]
MLRTVSDLIVDQLAAWGVRSIYGYAGDSILHLLDSLAKQDRIMFYATKHEANAAFMASAEAKMFGRLGVCLAHAGPGVANLLNGLADAYLDQAPVLALTGQVDTQHIGTDYKQYLDEQVLVRPVAAYSALISSPEAAADVLTKAMHTALAQGTVAHVAVPRDIFPRLVDLEIRPPEPYLTAYPAQPEENLDRVAAVLNEAERPMILVGRGSRGQGQAIAEFAEQWGAGIISTMPAKGVVPGEHPLVVGGLGEGGSEAATDLLKEADILLVLGATWWPPAYVPRQIKIVQIDANPASIGRRAPVYYGYVGKIGDVMAKLSAKVEPQVRGAWFGRIEEARRHWRARVAAEAERVSEPLAPQQVVRSLEKAVAPDAVIALDVGDHTLWFNRVFTGANQEVIASGTWRSMGFGLPAAIQAKLNNPARQVVALVGDGGLNMALPEFTTAVQYGVPVKVVVFNNGCLAMERNRMLAGNLKTEGTHLTNPDFAAYAEACGGHGYRVARPQELGEVLQKAMADETPCIVDVPVDPAIVPTVTPA